MIQHILLLLTGLGIYLAFCLLGALLFILPFWWQARKDRKEKDKHLD